MKRGWQAPEIVPCEDGAMHLGTRSPAFAGDVVAGKNGSKRQCRISFGGRQAVTDWGAEVYAVRMRRLNSDFANWAFATLTESSPDGFHWPISEGARDYVANALKLGSQFLVTRIVGSTSSETEVLSFGSGDCGQLGRVWTETTACVPNPVSGLSDKCVTMVACGGLHTVACTARGECYTWGCNDDGALGRDGEDGVAGLVDLGGEGATSVSAGDTHSLAVLSSGGLIAWGCYKDKEGKRWVEGGPRGLRRSPARIELEGKCSEASCGAAFTVALLDDGRCVTWGVAELGELGRTVRSMRSGDGAVDENAVATDYLVPKRVPLEQCTLVACGAYHLLVATARGQVYAAGLNNYGQLGTYSYENAKALTRVAKLGAVMAINAGMHHSIALANDGSIYVWGRADYGQLGLGPPPPSPLTSLSHPTYLPTKFSPTHIAAGSNHNLALDARGSACYAWGYGDLGALGTGHQPPTDLLHPHKCIVLARPFYVDAGGQHSVVLARADR